MAFGYYSEFNVRAAQVPSTQTDFPVLVSVTDARFKTVGNGGHVQNSSGFDIRPYTDSTLVTAITGYELERYNASTGEVVMWVKVSSLSSSTTPFVLAYGNASLTTDGSSTTTWSNSFSLVMHLKDGSTLSMADSTGVQSVTNHNATATTGQIDGGAGFASASSQYIDCGDVRSAAVTLSAWVKGTSFPNAYNTVGGWDTNTGGSRQAMIWVKSTGKMTFFVFGTGSVGYDGTGSHTLSTGTWYLVHLTYSSSAGLVGYVNAGSDGTAAANGALAIATTVPFYIGNDQQTAGRFWNGAMDEFRCASVVRSADWITTEYNNQSAPGTFETLGTEVAVAGINTGNFFMLFPS